MKRILIMGAGISALSLAYFLEKRYGKKIEIILIEKEKRIGGWLRTYKEKELLFELGPRGIRAKEITYALAQELGLSLIPAQPKAKRRYIALKEKLEEVNLGYLYRHCGLFSALCEGFKKSNHQAADESVASFFRRRLNQRYVDNVVTPLCQGIFAQDPEEISMQAAFPSLWNSSSITKAFFQGMGKRAPLVSFSGGMEALPQALGKAIHSPVLLETEVETIQPTRQGVYVAWKGGGIEGDHLFLAAPSLCGLLSPFPQKKVSLTVVNCAFPKEIALPPGFGFLSGRPPLLGITFDSEIFPEHNRHTQCLSLFLQGEWEEKEALAFSLEQCERYVHITTPPLFFLVSIARNAIYQYPVGHLEKRKQLEDALPPHITLTGSRFYGISVNDCLSRSQHLALEVQKEQE